MESSHIFALVFIGIGCLSLLYGIFAMLLSIKALSWETTVGEIISSKLIRTSGTSYSYKAEIVYKYRSKDREYTGTRIGYGYKGSFLKLLDKLIVNKFKKGSRVKIHYQQKFPEKSILMAGARFFHVITLFTGFGFIAVGYFIYQ